MGGGCYSSKEHDGPQTELGRLLKGVGRVLEAAGRVSNRGRILRLILAINSKKISRNY